MNTVSLYLIFFCHVSEIQKGFISDAEAKAGDDLDQQLEDLLKRRRVFFHRSLKISGVELYTGR